MTCASAMSTAAPAFAVATEAVAVARGGPHVLSPQPVVAVSAHCAWGRARLRRRRRWRPPAQYVRLSRAAGLLTDEQAEAALGMADERNLLVHIYREVLAQRISANLPGHAATLAVWLSAMRRHLLA